MKILIGNWKMNPVTRVDAIRLAKSVDLKSAIIAPPFTYIESVGKALRKATLGAQDVFWNKNLKGRAATGEISVDMLKNLGVKYVIIGHSERRGFYGETDALVNKKTIEVLNAGIKAVVCVGESWSVRKRGEKFAQKFVGKQLKSGLSSINRIKEAKNNLIIAYEPIWAIGTGKSASSGDASVMAKFIIKEVTKLKLSVKILYGGSVNGNNIREFLNSKGIDGALVGGASINHSEFKKIWRIASQKNK